MVMYYGYVIWLCNMVMSSNIIQYFIILHNMFIIDFVNFKSLINIPTNHSASSARFSINKLYMSLIW